MILWNSSEEIPLFLAMVRVTKYAFATISLSGVMHVFLLLTA